MALIGVSIALAILSLYLCRAKAAAFLSRLSPPTHTGPVRSKHKTADVTEISGNAETETSSERSSDRSSDSSHDQNPPTIELNPPTIMAVDNDDDPAPNLPTTPKASPKPSTNPSLMPPPARPQAPPSTSSLRIPSTGPLPNRSAPNQQTPKTATTLSASNAATASTLPPLSRPRKKVILPPGHSPLDWAHKTRTTAPQQLAGVPFPQRITPSQLAWATGRKGKPAWAAYRGRVYNIGPYLKFHPGGEGELMRAAGRDAAPLFDEVHAWVNWENMLGACLVGFLVQEPGGAS